MTCVRAYMRVYACVWESESKSENESESEIDNKSKSESKNESESESERMRGKITYYWYNNYTKIYVTRFQYNIQIFRLADLVRETTYRSNKKTKYKKITHQTTKPS